MERRIETGSSELDGSPRVYRGWPSSTIRPRQDLTVTTAAHLLQRQKIDLSIVFAGQTVGIKQTSDQIWLATFMDYDLRYLNDETCRLEPLPNPFGPKVLPMSSE